uniref:Retrotrans_gag domain-containing protein n=1 Tax=Strongyloides papillosus TaxID=174720 RepID=A0A0N5BEQ9_STREA
MPLSNRLSECYRKWRKASPRCQFGLLLEVERHSYNWELMEKFDASVMRNLKQREDESVMEFNTRFLQKLKELYPGYENNVYKIKDDGDNLYEGNFLKHELFNIYVTGPKPKISNRIPIVSGKEKCLEYAMKRSEFLDRQLNEREKTNRDRHPTVRSKVLGITSQGKIC